MLAIVQYIKERFPVPLALMFSFGYATLILGLSSENNLLVKDTTSSIVSISLMSSVFFFFLLRQRAIDEFRDAKHDLKNFPNRPVPRGLVSKKQVLLLGLFALVIEVVSAFLIGRQALEFYLLFFLYSLLMAKEFFIPEWLNKHFTTYFLIHEVIFLLLGLFFFFSLNTSFTGFNLHTFVLLGVATASPMGIEILRKFKPRYDKSGKPVADTYSTVWGRNNALSILMGLSLLVGLGLFSLSQSYVFLLFSLVVIALWITFGRKSDASVLIIGAINFWGFALLANIL